MITGYSIVPQFLLIAETIFYRPIRQSLAKSARKNFEPYLHGSRPKQSLKKEQYLGACSLKWLLIPGSCSACFLPPEKSLRTLVESKQKAIWSRQNIISLVLEL